MTTRVLHVVESFGGGVVSALAQHVAATPDLEHHLLRAQRPDYTDDGELARFASDRPLSPRPIGAATDVRRAVRELRPDVIHAHSSLGGALVRLTVARGRGTRIVYTPHGFASDRRDVGPLSRRAFAAAEWVLSWNTDVVAACSPREQGLAERGHAGTVVFVPNVAEPGPARERRTPPRSGRVAGVGRLCPQKDPRFFLEVVEGLRESGAAIDPVWIGGGATELHALLVDRGVRVTGWLPRSAALAELGQAEVYVHTSAWDAGPMALLEAAALGVPAVARRVPSLPGLPAQASGSTPAEVGEATRQILGEEPEARANVETWRQAFALHNPEEQRRRLLAAYGSGAEEETR